MPNKHMKKKRVPSNSMIGAGVTTILRMHIRQGPNRLKFTKVAYEYCREDLFLRSWRPRLLKLDFDNAHNDCFEIQITDGLSCVTTTEENVALKKDHLLVAVTKLLAQIKQRNNSKQTGKYFKIREMLITNEWFRNSLRITELRTAAPLRDYRNVCSFSA